MVGKDVDRCRRTVGREGEWGDAPAAMMFDLNQRGTNATTIRSSTIGMATPGTLSSLTDLSVSRRLPAPWLMGRTGGLPVGGIGSADRTGEGSSADPSGPIDPPAGLRIDSSAGLPIDSSVDRSNDASETTDADDPVVGRMRVEAALLLAPSPVNPRRLATLAGLPDATAARTAVAAINDLYDDLGRAMRIEMVAGGYQMMTRPHLARWLSRLSHLPTPVRLSPPMLETLTVVAYRGPVCRADIESIRGVACGEILRQLIQRDLVRMAGRSEELGRPYLYQTTKRFLQTFGLRSTDDLPPIAIDKIGEQFAGSNDPPLDDPSQEPVVSTASIPAVLTSMPAVVPAAAPASSSLSPLSDAPNENLNNESLNNESLNNEDSNNEDSNNDGSVSPKAAAVIEDEEDDLYEDDGNWDDDDDDWDDPDDADDIDLGDDDEDEEDADEDSEGEESSDLDDDWEEVDDDESDDEFEGDEDPIDDDEDWGEDESDDDAEDLDA